VTVIGRFAWKNSTRDTQSAAGQPLVVDGTDQALEIGLEAVGADLDRLTAGEHRDRRRKGVPGRHLGVKHEHRDDLDAVRDRGFDSEPDEVARVVDAKAARPMEWPTGPGASTAVRKSSRKSSTR
jgi:hypothetical protein